MTGEPAEERVTPVPGMTGLGPDDATLPPHQPHCLGCGDENPASMGLKLRVEGDRVRGEVTLDRRQEGAPGFAHGGALATILDDAMGSLLFVVKRPAVTGKLELDYRRPAMIGRRFEVEAWVDRIDGRKLHFRSAIRDEGQVVAEGSALFIEVAAEHFLKGAGGRSGVSGLSLPW